MEYSCNRHNRLIGGSFALAMRDKGVAGRIVGVDNSAGNCKTALEMKLVDEIMSLEDAGGV